MDAQTTQNVDGGIGRVNLELSASEAQALREELLSLMLVGKPTAQSLVHTLPEIEEAYERTFMVTYNSKRGTFRIDEDGDDNYQGKVWDVVAQEFLPENESLTIDLNKTITHLLNRRLTKGN